MESFDVKHLSVMLERQGQALERIAKAVERSNELLYTQLSQQQRESLALTGIDRLGASLGKQKK